VNYLERRDISSELKDRIDKHKYGDKIFGDEDSDVNLYSKGDDIAKDKLAFDSFIVKSTIIL